MTKKIKYLSLILLGICFIAFFILALPPTSKFIISIVEQLMGRELRDPGRWIEIIQHCSTIAMCIIGLTFYLGFSKHGNNFTKEILQECNPFFQFIKTKKFYILLLGTFTFYFLCFYKIILSDFYYEDDLWRSYDGSRSWIGFSRYISEFLSIILHTNLYLPDIAPLTQLFAIGIMSFSTILLAWLITDGKVTIISIIICSLLFLSPYNAQNLSYRFDSTYMALSALFPMIPFLFMKNRKIFIFTSIICLILCCMSYQSGTSIYILLSIYFATSSWLRRESYKEIGTFAGIAVCSFAIALIIFKLLFMNTLEDSSDLYYSTSLSLNIIPQNIYNYIKATTSNYGGWWIKICILLSAIVAFIQSIKISKQNKVITCIFIIGISSIAYILSYGPYLIFSRPLLAPRALTGFSMLITLLGMSIYNNSGLSLNIKYKPAIIPIVCLIYGFIVFHFAYGVALSEQKEYQDFRSTILLSDLSKFAQPEKTNNISFSGSIGLSNNLSVNVNTFPLIKELIASVPKGGCIWNDDLLKSYNFECDDKYLSENPGFPLLVQSYYHDIYGKDNNFFIVLK